MNQDTPSTPDLDAIPLLEDVIIPETGKDNRHADAEGLRQVLSSELQVMIDDAVDHAIEQVVPQLRQHLRREISLHFERHLTEAMRLMLEGKKS